VEGRFEASWSSRPALLEPKISGSASIPDSFNSEPAGQVRGRMVQAEQGAPAEGDRLSGRPRASELETPSKNPLKNQSGFILGTPVAQESAHLEIAPARSLQAHHESSVATVAAGNRQVPSLVGQRRSLSGAFRSTPPVPASAPPWSCLLPGTRRSSRR